MLTQRSLLQSPSVESGSTSLAQTPPEINLIPFIDVLLVILIFLMISTTFTQYQELSINLPSAEGVASNTAPREMKVAVSKEGRYAVNGVLVDANQLAAKMHQIASQWSQGAESPSSDTPEVAKGRIVISADAKASHQSVMLVLEVASQENIAQVVFATQDNAGTKTRKRSPVASPASSAPAN